MEMTPLNVALVCLVAAAVWAVVELALTIRRSRSALGDLSESLDATISEIRPVISKLDGMADELQPTAKELTPLVEKAQTAVDAVSLDLLRIDGILDDVSTVTGTGAAATTAVSSAVESVADAASGVIGRMTGSAPKAPEARLEGGASAEPAAAAERPSEEEARESDRGYFTYPAPAAHAAHDAGPKE